METIPPFTLTHLPTSLGARLCGIKSPSFSVGWGSVNIPEGLGASCFGVLPGCLLFPTGNRKCHRWEAGWDPGPQLPGCTALLKPELSPASGKVLPRPEVAGNWGMERAPSCGQRADVVGRMGLVFLKPWEGPMVGIRVLAIRESF